MKFLGVTIFAGGVQKGPISHFLLILAGLTTVQRYRTACYSAISNVQEDQTLTIHLFQNLKVTD